MPSNGASPTSGPLRDNRARAARPACVKGATRVPSGRLIDQRLRTNSGGVPVGNYVRLARRWCAQAADKCLDYFADNFILDGEDIIERSVEAVRPDGFSRNRINKLYVDANLASDSPCTPLQQVADAKLLADRAHVGSPILVDE